MQNSPSSAYKKAFELKENLNQILDSFIEVAEYWIEVENLNPDLIILKVSIKTNLRETLDKISGDISGLVTYEIEIEDIDTNGDGIHNDFPTIQVTQTVTNKGLQRFYEDIDRLDTLSYRPFVKEVSIEGDDMYSEALIMPESQYKDNLKVDRVSYEQENNYNLGRIIKIKVIDELII